MNDANYYRRSDGEVPDLDDPTFWSEVASQVDTTSLLQQHGLSQPLEFRSPSPFQHQYPQPTTDRLWLPAPRSSPPSPDRTPEQEEVDAEEVQEPRPSAGRGQAKKQSMLMPVLLIAFAFAVISSVFMQVGTTKTTPSNFTDTTPTIGDWDVHCHQGTPTVSIGAYSIVGPSTIDVDFINKILTYYHSPMQGQGQLIEDVSRYCGLDAAFVTAFFMHESSFGNAGEAASSLSPGNLRCVPGFACRDGYAWFESWQDGLMVQCRLLRNLYADAWGRYTPEQIIPKYAPAADNNNELAYELALKRAVDTWRQQKVVVS